MASVRFSLVIPTRERAGTLRWALKTCLAQAFDDFEVIVCDNCGSPATRQVVDECASSKIRYVRSPRLLSMSSNWDLAVSHAQGEYVLVIGDDDGLMPHALCELDRLITQTGAKAVRWTSAHYTWPDINLPGQGNYLRVPLSREIRTMDARAAIASVIAFQSCYTTLPMLYNSAVHRDLIADIRAKTGRVFSNIYPDVYSGFAVAWAAGSYLSVDLPMMVAGSSGRSYGVATLFNRGKSPLDHEYRSLNSQEQLLKHPSIPDLPIFPYVPVADSFLVAKDLLFPAEEELQLDRRDFITKCVDGLRADNESDWREAMSLLRDGLAADQEAKDWFDSKFSSSQFCPAPAFQMRSESMGYDGDFLHLNADAFGVTDVQGAAHLCEKILCTMDGNIKYGMKSHSQLNAAHRLIQATLEADCAELTKTLQQNAQRIAQLESDAAQYRARIGLLSMRVTNRLINKFKSILRRGR